MERVVNETEEPRSSITKAEYEKMFGSKITKKEMESLAVVKDETHEALVGEANE